MRREARGRPDERSRMRGSEFGGPSIEPRESRLRGRTGRSPLIGRGSSRLHRRRRGSDERGRRGPPSPDPRDSSGGIRSPDEPARCSLPPPGVTLRTRFLRALLVVALPPALLAVPVFGFVLRTSLERSAAIALDR